jgi:hypothetical protein
MIVLKLNTPEVAHTVAYMLRGRQFGQHVLLLKEDTVAIELAVGLAGGKILQCRRPIFMAITVIISGLLIGQSLVGLWIWTSLLSKTEQDWSIPTQKK